MNERIRELANQADIPIIDSKWDYNDREILVKDSGEWRKALPQEIIHTMLESEKGLEKFAELIVRECAGVGYDASYYECALNVSNKILEHFGVKE